MQVPIAFELACPFAPFDCPGLLRDTGGLTCGVWKFMPGLPAPSGSPTAAELPAAQSLPGTRGSLITLAGAATPIAAANNAQEREPPYFHLSLLPSRGSPVTRPS